MKFSKQPIKTIITIVLIAIVSTMGTACNRKYANAGDKKKAYKRKYKCKMCYNNQDVFRIEFANFDVNSSQIIDNVQQTESTNR